MRYCYSKDVIVATAFSQLFSPVVPKKGKRGDSVRWSGSSLSSSSSSSIQGRWDLRMEEEKRLLLRSSFRAIPVFLFFFRQAEKRERRIDGPISRRQLLQEKKSIEKPSSTHIEKREVLIFSPWGQRKKFLTGKRL